ncbi:TrmH family RNA methyltransferase [Apibacter muscae]|uniref:TrmH family RNA methyltransferase n=1 Tax=Apibacter muscae TaxID=2509004 RepID=A0A563DEG6_9FLAO|nr:RNA methyltransferase [Apibacter muscae]TWP28467.1 TrmH family RNA methyltransferase [Apibacter muscae]TWP30272.1 TrmH family RNA methyltransferase [Apibacter muscae]
MSLEKKTEKLKLDALNRKSIEEFKTSEKIPVVVLLDNIRSMNNVGSVFRTSDAFSIKKIFLCGITPCPPHREIQKTALGATESVDWEFYEDILQLIKNLKKEGYLLVGIEQVKDSILLQDFTINCKNKYALILGNEVDGITDSILDEIDLFVEIPQSGTKHSLNVSVCSGIILWEWYKNFI